MESRADERLARGRHLHELRPDLQFGADLAGELRRSGRGDEVEGVLRAWFQRAPESEQALASQALADLERERTAAAVGWARDLLLVHGDASHRLVLAADIFIAAGATREARAYADRLVQGPAHHRGHGRYRVGAIALLEGRFAAAMDAFEAALVDFKPYGSESETTQTLEALISLVDLVGRPADREKFLSALAAARRAFGMPASAAVVDYELAVRRGPPCPATAGFIATVTEPGEKLSLARDLARIGALHGCGSCAEVVRAGLSSVEANVPSVYRFARCAEQEGAWQLALDALTRIAVVRGMSIEQSSSASPYHSVLARFVLGRVHERMGHRAEARTAYQRFLDAWGHADRPVPEVEEARQALARLR